MVTSFILPGNKKKTLFVASAAVIIILLAFFVYWNYWPDAVDNREINRIGSPVIGAASLGNPHVIAGSEVCIDSCITMAKSYRVDGTLGDLAEQARVTLVQKGYRITQELECNEDGPQTGATLYILSCTIQSQYGKFQSSVTFIAHRDKSIVPIPSGRLTTYYGFKPPTNFLLSNAEEDIVEVATGT
jgi:hypothetical protein